MDQLRQEARQALEKDPQNLPHYLPSATKVNSDLPQLWENVSQYDNSNFMNACESLLTALAFLDVGFDPLLPNDEGPRPFQEDEIEAAANLFKWASNLALPSSEFAESFDATIEVTPDIKKLQEESRLKGKLAIEFLVLLTAKTDATMRGRGVSNSPDVILAMITFISKQDPWTTEDAAEAASMQLDVTTQSGLWPCIERILREKLRPLFTKQRNPKITSEGRKDLHPVPLPRFDASTLDDSTKPWKNTDIYATSALSWIVSQYKASEPEHLEAHFPLLVPAILTLIDDSNITFKIQGCSLLVELLQPILASRSDILIRTNLISVFEDAITPCLLSLPTITPEENSLAILKFAYPVLILLFKSENMSHSRKGITQNDEIKELSTRKLAKVLRSNLISSFNHVSYSASATDSFASFPYPRLSTFLLKQISRIIRDIGLDTIKYVQDILPLLQTTLSNPFGSAHPALLSAAVSATQNLISVVHPRIWRWRGEILAGLCACWLHIREETKEIEEVTKEEQTNGIELGFKEQKQDGGRSKDHASQLAKVARQLQIAVFVLKHVLQNPVAIGATPDPDQAHAKEQMEGELKKLVEADSELEDLLFVV